MMAANVVSMYALAVLQIVILSVTAGNLTGETLFQLLTNDRLQFNEMVTSYLPIPHLWQDIWQNAQLSKQEIFDSMATYPPKMAFNSLIGSTGSDIEVILSENDLELNSQLTDGFEKELKHTLEDVNMDRYLQFVDEMSSKAHKKKHHKSLPYNMNGAASDYRFVSSATSSTGMHGEYWAVSPECIKHKGCNVYPIFRILHETKKYAPDSQYLSFSCHDIMTQLLPQIYECIDKYGVKRCPLRMGAGLFRWVFKAKIPNSNEFVVIKMMKQTLKEKPRDLLRHLRESIFLHYLRMQELEYMTKYPNATFKSNLNEMRAFPYVYELGHCIYPAYISVSHLYNRSIDQFIQNGEALNANISQLVRMSLQIAQGIELLHSIPGGPYHHTDIRDDQFMIDSFGNVLINDFNRGKFQPYFFPKDDYNIKGNVEKCNFCPHTSHGYLRAPEEQISTNLDETIDIYSGAFVIWKLFTLTNPFSNVKSDDLEYMIYDTARRPPMPHNMPFALKEVIKAALSQNPKDRPNAKEFRASIQNVYRHLDQYTRNKQHFTSYFAKKHKVFRDRRYPQVSSAFPEFGSK